VHILKKRLVAEFNIYFDKDIAKSQKEKTIAAYLDPAIFGELIFVEECPYRSFEPI
jgi:hypothetical protein